MRNCKHQWRNIGRGEDGTRISERCSRILGCGEQLSLGPSNDTAYEVQLEIQAAEEIASNGDTDVWSDASRIMSSRFADELNASLWPWDTSRPIAGQYEEWLVQSELSKLGKEHTPPAGWEDRVLGAKCSACAFVSSQSTSWRVEAGKLLCPKHAASGGYS